MDVQIVQWFQTLESGFMNFFFGIFYTLLNPLFTMCVPIVLYYVFSKTLGYKVGVFYGVTSFFCGTLKEIFVRERPFVAHPDKIKPLIENQASGASMPSGHAMGSIGLAYPLVRDYGYVSKGQKKRIWVFVVASVVVILIGFSRIYMGGHYLTDILAGWGFGFAIAFAVDIVMQKLGDKFYLWAMLILPVMLILICILPESDSCAVGLAFTSAILLGGFLEKKFVNLEIKIKWWWRLLRVYIAIMGAFLCLFAVTIIFEAIAGFGIQEIKTQLPIQLVAEGMEQAQIDRAVKSVSSVAYFAMFFFANAWAFVACPFLFKHFPKLFKKKNNEVTA